MGVPQDWAAVKNVLEARMDELDVSWQELAARTRLSKTTVREILEITNKREDSRSKTHQLSSLVCMAAVLEWPYYYLIDILHGTSAEELNARIAAESAKSPLETRLEILVQNLSRVRELREAMESLRDTAGKAINIIGEIAGAQDPDQPQ